MSEPNLDKEEQALLEAFENDELQSDLDEDRRRSLISDAEGTFRKDRRINIRLSSRDLNALQRRALEEGLPYQTLVASILHKYVSGTLKDLSTEKPLPQHEE
ncbi:MAG: hypothetical protein ACOC48_03675 [Thiohalospira sp.]|uniref:hypothetical protein n=1 Tax=Thiohalospira sp. TaxID=3080549 RepID=UPI003980339C